MNIKRLCVFIFLVTLSNVTYTYSQTEEQKQRIRSKYNTSLLSQMSENFLSTSKADKKNLINQAKRRNLELALTLKDSSYAELQKIDDNGTPIYYRTFNVDASRSTRTNHLHIGGSTGFNLEGQGMTAGVWDGGHARASHQEYQSGSDRTRLIVMDEESEGGIDLNFHAGHVTGTVMASGVVPEAKGMAPQANVDSYKWNDDLAEVFSAASNGMLISNHSYGFRSDQLDDYFFGAYITNSRSWDILHYNAPYYLMVVAAGNDGSTSHNDSPLDPIFTEYDKLTGQTISKNNLVVASARDANLTADGELVSVSISNFSSQGPTDDLRIKPDITGNGQGVYSTYANADNAYNTISGTSMASPNVAGSALLLQQHFHNLYGQYMRSASLKGLILHTADDAGMEGPDAIFGWGLMNSKRAAEAISNKDNGTIINDLSLFPGETFTLEVESNEVDALLASISWTDPAGEATTELNSDTPRLVNDLDIVVEQDGTEHLPWRLTGVNSNERGNNTRDNFERVDIGNASGTYTIKVTHKGELTNGQQNYTLTVTGLVSEPVVCNAEPPSRFTLSGFDFDSASFYWDDVPSGEFDFRYREEGEQEWIEVSVATSSINIEDLKELTTYEAQVRTNCVNENTTSDYSEVITFTTEEFELEYCDSRGIDASEEHIGRVRLHNIDNPSDAGPGYSDFTNVTTDLVVGDSYTVTVTPEWAGTVYPEGIAVWIDFNLNGDFTDPGEQIMAERSATSDEVSATFTVPEGAVEGEDLRMRVSLKFEEIPSPCETFQWGEVEDYTVVVLPAGSCNVLPPQGESSQDFCEQPSLVDIEVDAEHLVWYTQEPGGEALPEDYSITGGETLYAEAVEGDCASKERLAVTVNIGDFESPTPVQSVLEYIVSQCDITSLEAPVAEDNCDDGEIKGTTSVEFPITESTVITWTYKDSSGNVSTQRQNVVIVEDVEAPEIVLQEDITIEFDENGVGSLSVDDVDGGSIDNCGIASRELSQVNFSCDDYEGEDEPVEVTFTVTDTSGNVSEMLVKFTILDPTSKCSFLSTNIFDKTDLRLFPNPTKETLNLELGTSDISIDHVRVYDMRGKQLMSIQIEPYTKPIDVSSLSSGNYFLVLTSGKDTLTKRFIKE